MTPVRIKTSYDPDIRILAGPNGTTSLSPVLGTIMRRLIGNAGKLVSRDAMMTDVYGPRAANPPEEKIMDVHLLRLRRKLLKIESEWTINTVWGSGWTLITMPPDESRPN